MSEIEVFRFPATGSEVRSLLVDDEPWFVGRDACSALGIADARASLNLLDGDERDTIPVTDSLGREQQTIIINESGLYSLILRSRRPEAKRFKRWITHDVLPAIRRTGRYGPEPTTSLDSIDIYDPRTVIVLAQAAQHHAQRAMEEARLRQVAEQRAAELEPAAQNWEAIEAGDGIPLRVFHKKYFSDVTERVFFEHLYRREYLIDQRGKGTWSERRQRRRDGAQHRHPSHTGKPYLYLHTAVDNLGVRRESVRVRPGQEELEFRALLIREGLPPNQTTTDIARRAA